jgi:ADP-heptose:LPS heptosyltransferase
MRFTRAEMDRAHSTARALGQFVVVEPHILDKSNPNKRWGWARWQKLAHGLSRQGLRVVQMGPGGVTLLHGVTYVRTASFRRAAALLSLARVAVLPEGGLHHAAGVLRVPSVVLYGGTPPVSTTSYPGQLVFAPSEPCGKWLPCVHCARHWHNLTPEHVLQAVLDYMRGELTHEASTVQAGSR